MPINHNFISELDRLYAKELTNCTSKEDVKNTTDHFIQLHKWLTELYNEYMEKEEKYL